ncbi:partial putative ABC transporter ATP-binding protein, partial [Patescibacteria group bacterium]
AVTLSVTVILFVITQVISPILKRLNRVSLDATGNLSAQIQEGLSAFKVIIAFNRRDYFADKFQEFNEKNYLASIKADIASQFLKPIYDLASSAAQVIVVVYGLSLVTRGEITFGLLFTFFTYTQRFYDPLRMMAQIWSNVQLALAAWSRINQVLKLESNLRVVESSSNTDTGSQSINAIEFEDVNFGYQNEDPILKNVNLELEKGKTYALVGPTGGGKSTTASLMVRLYDPTSGVINFWGKDIKSYSFKELSNRIGFILQDPLLFTGTVGENIRYGNNELASLSDQELLDRLKEAGLSDFIEKFDNGLETAINNNAENISLGQKQIISFIRIILRNPDLLILDEATANIDTVTEELLQNIINKLPKKTTKVIIAHRLNTIKKADQIFFVNNGSIEKAKDFKNVESLILKQKRSS